MLSEEIKELYKLYQSCGRKVCTDTRQIQGGELFVCLKGEHFDGNKFAETALELGAKAVLTSQKEYLPLEGMHYVEDTLKALQLLAQHRRLNSPIKILGIGGSNGKTTTKELCYEVLKPFFRTYATPGNFNNHIGVPLTLLGTREDTEICITELGTNHPGEIEVLCNIAQPSIGLITNIGKEHLEGFGDIEAVAKEESALFHFLIGNQSPAIINLDDPWLSSMGKRFANKITIGINRPADIQGILINEMPYLEFECLFKGESLGKYTAGIGGKFNLYNILFAVAVGHHFGIDPIAALKNAAQYTSENNRSQWVEMGSTKVLLDAYNANPSSVEEVLKSFATLPGKKAAAIGSMLELGNSSEEEHAHIYQLAHELPFHHFFFCGKEFKSLAQSHEWFENAEQLAIHIKDLQPHLDYLLIKGSRGMKMERIIQQP